MSYWPWPSENGSAWLDWTTTVSSTSTVLPVSAAAATTSTTSSGIDYWPWPSENGSAWLDWTASSTSASTLPSVDAATTSSALPTTSLASSVTGYPAWPSENGSAWLDWTRSVSSTSTSSAFAIPTIPANWSHTGNFSWEDWETTTSSTVSTLSVDASTTSSSLSTATSLASTSTTSESPASSLAPPATDIFYISATSGQQTKRDFQYLGWANGLGVLVSDRSSAAQFFLDTEDYLRVGSSYVDTDSSQPYLIFHLTTTKSGNLSKWTIDANGILSLQSQSVSTCVDQSGTVFIVFGGSGPSGCSATILDISPVASESSSTTTSSATSTTTVLSTISSYPTNGNWSDWNGNETSWLDWKFTSTPSSSTASPLPVDAITTSTSAYLSSTSQFAYPSSGNWSNYNDSNSVWLDWTLTSSTSTSLTTSASPVDAITTSTSAYITTSSHSAYPSNGNWSNLNDTNSVWLDWSLTSSTSTSLSASASPVDALTTSSSASLTSSSHFAYPSSGNWSNFNDSNSVWLDWSLTSTSTSLTTSALPVDAITTSTSSYVTTSSTVAYPSGGNWTNGNWSNFNDSNSIWLDWSLTSSSTTASSLPVDAITTSTTSSAFPYPTSGNWTNGNWTNFNDSNSIWLDWTQTTTRTSTLYVTSTSSLTTTTPNMAVDAATTWSSSSTSTSGFAFPTIPAYTGPGNWSNYNDSNSVWLDWTTTSSPVISSTSSTTSTLSVAGALTSTTSSLSTTSSSAAFPTIPAYNGSYPGANWTDWNGTWADTTSSVMASSTTSSVAGFPTVPAYNGSLGGNWTDWTDWNGTVPWNITVSITTSSSLTTTTSTPYVPPAETSTSTTSSSVTTTGAFSRPWPTQTVPAAPIVPHNGTAGNWTGNSTYPANDTSSCDATAPSQILQNPSFECSETGWTLDEVDIVWGGVSDSSPPSKRRRDISSPDEAYDGKGFARFQPTFEDVTATLAQTLSTPATKGSYWYSFAYRVPASGDTPDGCTLTVSNDEGTLATIGSLSTASAWTMTGLEFQITSSASSFSFVFSCDGADTTSPLLDIDNIRLGLSDGSWTGGNGTTGGYSNSTGLPTWGSTPGTNLTFSPPPVNSSSPYGERPPVNLTAPSNPDNTTYGEDGPSTGSPGAAYTPTAGNVFNGGPAITTSPTLEATSTLDADALVPTPITTTPSAAEPSTTTVDPTPPPDLAPTTTSSSGAGAELPTVTPIRRHRYHRRSA
ncbi:hypothetical protein PV04_04697 [Phialophora macrospora]|uniref:DUF7908 domain-containing protein n=1 Tax=Phialophora macrospora TaxID=1851006 RepID=A0A0D2CUB8_9EURO|nr:hypothetical protein PV04_04697 [Phialophora macrospora]